MRFCMVTTFYPPYSYGGDATYVRALARELVKRGHEVEVIANTDAYRLRGPEPAKNDPADDGVLVHRLKTRSGFFAPLLVQQTGQPMIYRAELHRLMSRDFDVIHFHNVSLIGGPGILPLGEAKLRLYTTHEHWLVCPTHVFWKNRSKACDGKTCFSCSLRSGIPPQLWRYSGYVRQKLEPIDLLLSPSEFTAARHRDAGIDTPIRILPLFSNIMPGMARTPKVDPATFLFCGRLTASKGVEQLLQAATRNRGITVKIVGEGDEENKLKARYASHSNIKFLGRVEQDGLKHHYASATALVLPSIAPETFGLTVVEAAGFGTPAIVSSGSGGAADIVGQSGGGLVYKDLAGLDAALRSLASDPSLREVMGRRAEAAYRNLYTADHHLVCYLDLVNVGIEENAADRRLAS